MSKTETVSNNETLAKFLGWLSGAVKYTNNSDDPGILLYQKPISKTESQFYSVEELQFDKSWDWLMPVVNKIGQLEGVYAVKAKELIDPLSIWSDIIDVYFPVVEFILWYNSQSPATIK